MPVDPISTASAAFLQITGAIRQAAQAVGTSFSYLLATARVESNFDPNAKTSTSSARGLFQFIEQTWLSTMKEAGPRLGYGSYADAIVRTPSGRPVNKSAIFVKAYGERFVKRRGRSLYRLGRAAPVRDVRA